jgi:RNA methyltransferase, TrmH family
VDTITSRQNPMVRRFRAAAQNPTVELLLDGAHLIEEAVSACVAIELVAIDDSAKPNVVGLAHRAESAGARVIRVPAKVLSAMTPVRQPSGVVAIARRKERSLAEALAAAPQMVLILDEVQDPGNVGAIVRAAEACGATGVITGEGTADPMGWKALRGSMGSIFRLPVAVRQNLAAAVRAARALGVETIAAVPRDGVLLPELDLRRPVAVLLGGEGGGLRDSVVNLATTRLTIPMRRPVESLNVATAAALIAYEAQRQRTSVIS